MKPYTVIKPHLKIFPESKNNLKTSEVAWSIHLPNQIQRGTIPQPKININRPHIIEKKSPKKVCLGLCSHSPFISYNLQKYRQRDLRLDTENLNPNPMLKYQTIRKSFPASKSKISKKDNS
jgi:hypothetical protein